MQVTYSSSSSIQGIDALSLEGPSQKQLAEFFRNKVVFFTGFPGSGKGTQGKKFAHLGVVHLSTGELFRREAESGSAIGRQMKKYMDGGEVIPKELTFSYLEKELQKPEYRNGIFLDGYPKNKESFEHLMPTLQKLTFQPLAAIHFSIPRALVIDRLTGRLHCKPCERDYHQKYLPPAIDGQCDTCKGSLESRSDDTPAAITKRLDVFEEKTQPVIECFKRAGIYHVIDASKTPEGVKNEIIGVISSLYEREIHEGGSYFMRPPAVENLSVFHNHIDARTHQVVREIVCTVEDKLPHAQNKLYPISHLYLGPQVQNPEFSSVYQSLPNFHPISDAKDEAFSTGKMGTTGFDYDQVKQTLDVAFQHPGQGVMTELEEEIYGREYDSSGGSKVVLNRGNTPYTVDWEKLPGYRDKQIDKVPRFELHHGFDIKKLDGESFPPISLKELSEKTHALGFTTGGWFVFRKDDTWAYRSNEFSNKEYTACLQTVDSQALQLRGLVSAIVRDRVFSSSCSIEKVHAIWRVK